MSESRIEMTLQDVLDKYRYLVVHCAHPHSVGEVIPIDYEVDDFAPDATCSAKIVGVASDEEALAQMIDLEIERWFNPSLPFRYKVLVE